MGPPATTSTLSSASSSAPSNPLSSIKNRSTLRQIEVLKDKLRRRQISGPYDVSIETATLLKTVVSNAKFSSIDELIISVKEVGRVLSLAQPKELAAGNITRKILRLIREEYRAFVISSQPPSASSTLRSSASFASHIPGSSTSALPSLSLSSFLHSTSSSSSHTAYSSPGGSLSRPSGANSNSGRLPMGIVDPVLLTPSHPIPPTPSTLSGASYDLPEWQWDDSASSSNANGKKAASIKPLLIQAIQEVIEEVETVVENVAKNAGSHIHSTEIILTLGHSRTIEAFLKHAAKDRKFTVIIAETSPSLSGHSLAKALATPSLPSYPNPIPTLLIPDSNIYAFIPRCTKLLLPSSAVLSSGGSLTPSLGLLAATAAKANSVQVVVCAGQYKLTPSWGLSGVGGAGGDARDPGEVLAFGEGGRMGFSAKGGRGAKMGGLMSGEVEVVNPRWDYVGPELIDVFLTDHGDHAPSYIYRLIKETYDDEDIDL